MTNAYALDAHLGPFHDTAGVQRLLEDGTGEALAIHHERGTILAVTTSDGHRVYPAWQFTGSTVDPALTPAIQALRNTDPWSAALWFVTPNPDLDEQTPLNWATHQQSPDRLLTSAHHTAYEWH